MRVAISGGTGLVGRFLTEAVAGAGHEVVLLSRRPVEGFAHVPFALGDRPDVEADVLVHAAYHHVAGRYRGGEGDDPEGFRRANVDGSLRLMERFPRTVFLSSRAVYDGQPAGSVLTEDLTLSPDGLYGQVKAEVEAAADVSLRATGIYGAGVGHKWTELFDDFLNGRPVAPRVATEVHGADLAAAVLMFLENGRGAFNVSDLLLDRRDLLAEVASLTGCTHELPERSGAEVSAMDCTRLRTLGWVPGGWGRLIASLPAMVQSLPSR